MDFRSHVQNQLQRYESEGKLHHEYLIFFNRAARLKEKIWSFQSIRATFQLWRQTHICKSASRSRAETCSTDSTSTSLRSGWHRPASTPSTFQNTMGLWRPHQDGTEPEPCPALIQPITQSIQQTRRLSEPATWILAVSHVQFSEQETPIWNFHKKDHWISLKR